MFWLVGIIVGIGAAIGTLRWALREHRAERKPWLDLLGSSAVDGIADDGAGTIPPLTAPFTGRPCLGYLLEIVVEEPNVNEKTFYRAFTDGRGQLALRGHDGRPLGRFDLGGGGIIFPTPLEEYGKYSSSLTNETVFHGTMDRAPWQLAAFVQRLDPGVQELVWRPSQMLGGKRVYFNERIVVPGQPIVVAGSPARVAHGTVASERARVGKLPVASELFGAIMAGVIACAFVNMLLAMTVAK